MLASKLTEPWRPRFAPEFWAPTSDHWQLVGEIAIAIMTATISTAIGFEA